MADSSDGMEAISTNLKCSDCFAFIPRVLSVWFRKCQPGRPG